MLTKRAAGLMLVVALMMPGVAFAAGPDRELTATAEAPLQMARVDVAEVPITCSPSSIECGIPCGMTDMCGQDPCLCGSVDEFGACACNGMEVVEPTFQLEGDAPVLLVEAFGSSYLIPMAEGPTDVTVRVSLPHHADALVPVRMEVAPLGPLDVAKVAALLVVAAAIVFGLVMAVRALTRRIRLLRCLRQDRSNEEA